MPFAHRDLNLLRSASVPTSLFKPYSVNTKTTPFQTDVTRQGTQGVRITYSTPTHGWTLLTDPRENISTYTAFWVDKNGKTHRERCEVNTGCTYFSMPPQYPAKIVFDDNSTTGAHFKTTHTCAMAAYHHSYLTKRLSKDVTLQFEPSAPPDPKMDLC